MNQWLLIKRMVYIVVMNRPGGNDDVVCSAEEGSELTMFVVSGVAIWTYTTGHKDRSHCNMSLQGGEADLEFQSK